MRLRSAASVPIALGAGLMALMACAATPTARPESPGPSSLSPAGDAASPSVSAERAPLQPRNPAGDAVLTRRIDRLLAKVQQTERAPYRPGYDRSCKSGGACQFGEEWTDRHPGRFARNGCTTREDVLLQQMKNIEMRWGSSCRIYEASFKDPYSGERLTWRDDGYWIQIDHIYPLAEAWHAGAWQWTQRQRVRFANDVEVELLAVSAVTNNDKGSQTPSEWLPPNKSFRCEYVARYLAVAATYDLSITTADAATIGRVARRC
jgi:Protein of unknown function (DUF1524)